MSDFQPAPDDLVHPCAKSHYVTAQHHGYAVPTSRGGIATGPSILTDLALTAVRRALSKVALSCLI